MSVFRTIQPGIKVCVRNTWDWVTVNLRKSDADYIVRYCRNRKECVPVLRKRGKKWYLDFSFQEKVKLEEKEIWNTRILAVDLGINNACTCCVMEADGTVGRKGVSFPSCRKRLSGPYSGTA